MAPDYQFPPKPDSLRTRIEANPHINYKDSAVHYDGGLGFGRHTVRVYSIDGKGAEAAHEFTIYVPWVPIALRPKQRATARNKRLIKAIL
ncbi:hypothetical protein [Larkinella soli]|uniref:hypothetical protein n=1 Tax=Larkinella soli TaxID=1770527 RepID=UPI000FFB2B0F|nr:hypothetical protein [Larkinella soli]